MSPDQNGVNVFLIDAEALGLEDDLHLQMPTSSSFDLSLVDHDAGECRFATMDELRPMFVDNEIDTIGPLQPDPWTLDPDSIDKQDLRITYLDGRTLGIQLGSIDKHPGHFTRLYRKTNGIVFPIGEDGRMKLDATNTPLLSAVRRDFHEQLAKSSQKRLEIAEIVNAFAGIVALNGARPTSF